MFSFIVFYDCQSNTGIYSAVSMKLSMHEFSWQLVKNTLFREKDFVLLASGV